MVLGPQMTEAVTMERESSFAAILQDKLEMVPSRWLDEDQTVLHLVE